MRVWSFFIGRRMKIIEMAGIKIGFSADFEVWGDEKLGLFLAESEMEECDFVFEVECGNFPEIPRRKPLYENSRECVFENKDTWSIFYRHPGQEWEFCVTRNEDDAKIHVLPRYKKYAENMWNLINKIELSSLLLEKQALILHASFVIHEDKAILFTGPSGIGKSTQAKLWEENKSCEIINGDRALIKRRGGTLWAFGIPFSGSSGICFNKEAPIQGIVILEQGNGNCVCTVTEAEAVKFLYSQTAVIRRKELDVLGTFELLEEFVAMVPVVRFICRPEKEAVSMLSDYFEKEDEEKCEY